MQHNTSGVTYGFSSRRHGDLRREELRASYFSSLGRPASHLILAQQIHGSSIARVSRTDRGRVIPGADGLVYKKNDSSRVLLAARVADCVPVLLWDARAGIIAAVHAGWKGTRAGIVTQAIGEMVKLGAQTGSIRAAIGPHIRSCCYDVPRERAELFSKRIQRGGTYYLSLTDENVSQMEKSGIPRRFMRVSTVCTSCSVSKYFSYRADSNETFGEQLGWIAI
jgi:YfiH family protein